MFIRHIDLSDESNISTELTLALLTVDRMCDKETYFKFRGWNAKNNASKHIDALKEEILTHKQLKNIDSCYDAIVSYLIENKIIGKGNISQYKKIYMDVALEVNLDDIKYSYARSKDFRFYLSNHILKEWNFSKEEKSILQNLDSSAISAAVEYAIEASGNEIAGSNFQSALEWAKYVWFLALTKRQIDLRNVMFPKAATRKSSGENDDFNISNQLTLNEVKFSNIKGFIKLAKSIYELNKRLYYTSKSGMIYSYTTYIKDMKRKSITDGIKAKLDSLHLTDFRSKFAKDNTTLYTKKPNVSVDIDTVVKRINDTKGLVSIYTKRDNLDSSNYTQCYYDALEQQKLEARGKSKNDIIVFSLKENECNIRGGIDRGASAPDIHFIIYSGIIAIRNLEAQLKSQGLSLLDVPDDIFYDESFLRRVNSFEEYMKYIKVIRSLEPEDNLNSLTIPNLNVVVPDNKQLVKNLEIDKLTSEEFKGIKLIPLRTILNKAKSYDDKRNEAIMSGKKFVKPKNDNINSTAKSFAIGSFDSLTLSRLKKETALLYKYWESFKSTGIIDTLKNLPGIDDGPAYNTKGYYEVAGDTNTLGKIKECKVKFENLLVAYIVAYHKLARNSNGIPLEFSKEILLSDYILPSRKLIKPYSDKYSLKGVAMFMLRYYVLLTYCVYGTTKLVASLVERSNPSINKVKRNYRDVIMSETSNTFNLDHIAVLDEINRHKNFLDSFIKFDENNQIRNKPIFTLRKFSNNPDYEQAVNLAGLSYPVESKGVENCISIDLNLSETFEFICNILPHSLRNDLFSYYADIYSGFAKNKIESTNIFAPYTEILQTMLKYCPMFDSSRPIDPDFVEVDGFYTYKGLPVKVSNKNFFGSEGYLSKYGVVIYPNFRSDLVLEPYEIFSDKHIILNDRT